MTENELADDRDDLATAFDGLDDALHFVRHDAQTISALAAVGQSGCDSFVRADAVEALAHVCCYLKGHITDLQKSVRRLQDVAADGQASDKGGNNDPET